MKAKLMPIVIVFSIASVFSACGKATEEASEELNNDIIINTDSSLDDLPSPTPVNENKTKTDSRKTDLLITEKPTIEPTVPAVGEITSHYQDVDFNVIYNLEGDELSENGLSELEEYLKGKDLKCLLNSEFSKPQEISMEYTFYNDLDFSNWLTDAQCEQFYPGEEVWWEAWYNSRQDINTYLMKYTGLPITYYEDTQPEGLGEYHESIDGYLHGVTDTCAVVPSLSRGVRNGEIITVWYKNLPDEEENNIRLTLKKIDDYYQPVSNMTEARLKADYMMQITDTNNFNFASYTSKDETVVGLSDVTYYYWKDTKELVYATQEIAGKTVSYYFLDGDCFYIHNQYLLFDFDKDLNRICKDSYSGDNIHYLIYGEEKIISNFESMK
jgi:hypothetical protein